MQDRELYRRILGIEAPWQVERVELKLEKGEVHIYLEHAKNVSWLCPECSAPSPLHDHQPERCWRHLDTCSIRPSVRRPATDAMRAARDQSGQAALGGSRSPFHGPV